MESDLNIGADLDSSSVDHLALESSNLGFGSRKRSLRKSFAKAPAVQVGDMLEEEEEIEAEISLENPQDADSVAPLRPSRLAFLREWLGRTYRSTFNTSARALNQALR